MTWKYLPLIGIAAVIDWAIIYAVGNIYLTQHKWTMVVNYVHLGWLSLFLMFGYYKMFQLHGWLP